MKRLFLSLAVLLPASIAIAQEASDPGKYAEVTFVARAEYSSVQDDHLGNSSIYALLDGAFSENLSFSVATHLLSSDPKALYQGTLYSDTTNWLDWAYLTWSFGQFELDFGKNMIQWGTFEMQEYDFDSWYDLASSCWLNLPIYQWGTCLRWAPTEDFYLGANFTTSPFGERPFASGLFQYGLSASWSGCDWYNGLWSYNVFDTGEGVESAFNMGTKFILGDNWELVWDSTTDFAGSGYMGSNMLYANYRPAENWYFMLRGGFDRSKFFGENFDRWYTGALACWNPIECLRVHALAAYDSMIEAPTFNIGVTWQITL